MGFDVNYISIIAAAVASMAIGFAWYSPAFLGKSWMKEMGLTKDKMKEMKKEVTKIYIVSLVMSLVMAFVLAQFVGLTLITTLGAALELGFWIWLGFIATIMLTEALHSSKSVKLYSINAGYQLVSILVMAVIITLMV